MSPIARPGYAKMFLTEHYSDILLHKTAKKHFDSLGLKKLATVKAINAEYAALLTEKKRPTPITERPAKK